MAGSGAQYYRLSKNFGSSVARNYGKTSQPGIMSNFLDSDDVLIDGSVPREYSLGCKLNADIVVSGWREFDYQKDTSEKLISDNPAPVFFDAIDDLLAGKAVPTSAALYKRKLIASVDWDPNLAKLNDWDFFVSAALVSTKIATANVLGYERRQHYGERITNSSSLLANAKEFFRVLEKLELSLGTLGVLHHQRSKRIAQYLYKELRVAYRFDPPLGKKILKKIFELDPAFFPRDEEHSRIFGWICTFLPLHPSLSAYGFVRRTLDRVTRASKARA